jgi:hypothetical protein
VIRKTVGLKGEKLTGDWRKFHEELYKLWFSCCIIMAHFTRHSAERHCVSRVRVYSTSTTFSSDHRIIIVVSADVGIKLALASTFGLASSRTLSWASVCYLTSWQLRNILIFLELFYRSAWRRASSCEADVDSAQRSSSALGLWMKCLAVVERDIAMELDWTWRAYCMASSVAEPSSDRFFSFGTPELEC